MNRILLMGIELFVFAFASQGFSQTDSSIGSTLRSDQFLREQGSEVASFSGLTCNYSHSDDACERSTVGGVCRVNNRLGVCAQVDSTGNEADCRCTPTGSSPSPAPSPSPSPVPSNRCNYSHSDNACERSTVGAYCRVDNRLGVCAQVDSTGNEADCRCTLRDIPQSDL